MRAPKILAVASAIDLDFRYGCTPDGFAVALVTDDDAERRWAADVTAVTDAVHRARHATPVRGCLRWHRACYAVLPGMTGLWQISGRSGLTFDDLVRLDFTYLENWSIWLDITIIARTIPAVITRRGAY